jgi:protein SCO1/2
MDRRAMLLMWLAALWISPALAADPAEPLDRRQVLALSEAALGRQVNDDFRFTATDGRVVAFSDLRGKPLVLSLIYSSCYHTCPLITQHLAEVVEKARAALGEASFTVATVGFDTPNDTPIRMRQFQKEQGVGDPQWLFLSADAETIRGLTQEVGFTYMASTKGFDHLAQATLLDRDGRVYRQVYGDKFPPPVLIEPLKELVFSTPAGAGLVAQVTNEIKLFCTVFDPTTGKYRFDYSLFVEIFVGLTCLGAVAAFVIRSWRQAA